MVATFDGAPLDYARETDVFVVGYAGEVGSQFFQTALTYAHKTHEQFPDRQIVFYIENRVKDFTDSAKVVKYGLVDVMHDDLPLTTTKLMGELKTYERLHTLQVVSHAALENGVGLTDRDPDGRWSNSTPGLGQLHFVAEGYVVLH